MKKDDIGVVITTYNEERNIEECIKSARLVTNQIVVVDTQSTDKTAELAKKKWSRGLHLSQQPIC